MLIKMKIFLICTLFWFILQIDCDENTTDIDSALDKVMKQYESDPIFQQVKEEFRKKYGNKDLNVLERMQLLKEHLQKFYKVTNRESIPDDLKSIFKMTMKSMKPDFTRVDHSPEVLKTVFNLTDSEANNYRQMYNEVEAMFAELNDRFDIEGDC